jgi:membrane-associated PAP2 superfamily phosphatase
MLMPWVAQHEWPRSAQCVFNFHRHFAILVICAGNEDLFLLVILLSKEDVTQGDPLAMVMHGVALLPLIGILKKGVSDVHQPWHADNAGAGGRFQNVRLCLEKLQEFGPPRGCFPEPQKSILVAKDQNEEKLRLVSRTLVLKS